MDPHANHKIQSSRRTHPFSSHLQTTTTAPTNDPRLIRRLRRQYHQITNELYHNALQAISDNHTPQDTTQALPHHTKDTMNNTSNLPKLDSTNYVPWYYALESYAASIDATEHLSSDPTPPLDPALAKTYTQKKSQIFTSILSSVPSSILGLLIVPGDRPTPRQLCHNIIKHINQSTKEDHRYLKTEAETIKFTGDHSIDDLIKDHTTIRQRMIAGQYPAIADEETTVDFIISGLQQNTSLTLILGNLIATKLTTIKDFTRKFKALQNLYRPIHGTTLTPAPYRTHNESCASPTRHVLLQQNPVPYSRAYRGQFRSPYYPTRHQQVTTQKPCSFHISLGIQAQHTDAECRDPHHPKNIRAKH